MAEFDDILRRIKSRYKEKEKVEEKYVVENVLRPIYGQLSRRLNSMHRSELTDCMRYIETCVKKGMKAIDLYKEVLDLCHRFSYKRGLGEDVSKVRFLEHQIANMREMIKSPTKIEHKIYELEKQIELIREESLTQIVGAEKQEDMLKKYNDAEKRAFIIMPFAPEFDNVWLGGIKPACAEYKYAPLRVDEISLSSLITDDIQNYMKKASIVIVDITENNPNVMFEFGWALAKDKKPIVICQEEHTSKVPFDILNIRHISYENSWLGVEELKKGLKRFIASTNSQLSKKKVKKTKKKSTKTAKKHKKK